VLGVVYKLNPAVNLYASAARGFETPTLNEMFYSGAGGGFNFGLNPAAALRDRRQGLRRRASRVNLALFQITTEDELVVAASTGGRTSYKNAGKTLRQGVEASFDTAWRATSAAASRCPTCAPSTTRLSAPATPTVSAGN
jgi:iron complex outermembrane receptor protein